MTQNEFQNVLESCHLKLKTSLKKSELTFFLIFSITLFLNIVDKFILLAQKT